jgi:hypothetical protein
MIFILARTTVEILRDLLRSRSTRYHVSIRGMEKTAPAIEVQLLIRTELYIDSGARTGYTPTLFQTRHCIALRQLAWKGQAPISGACRLLQC